MVNTFLPDRDFTKTAQSLDRARLGKQRVEALQILRANLGLTKGWVNHPAAVMWRGHDQHLARYALTVCQEWRDRGYQDNCSTQVEQLILNIDSDIGPPWWLGYDDFHQSHQSNLLRKDPTHYTYDVDDDLPYLWPTQTIGVFRTVERKP